MKHEKNALCTTFNARYQGQGLGNTTYDWPDNEEFLLRLDIKHIKTWDPMLGFRVMNYNLDLHFGMIL